MLKTRIAVFVSGGGTNLQALIDAQRSGLLRSGKIVLVISSRPDAFALERARRAGIETAVVSARELGSQEAAEARISALLEQRRIELIILAGYMSILSADFTARWPERILNVHPSLIPAFCGKGYYGLRVHEAALARGVKLTGATVHFVNEIPDGGKILLQQPVAGIGSKGIVEHLEIDDIGADNGILGVGVFRQVLLHLLVEELPGV